MNTRVEAPSTDGTGLDLRGWIRPGDGVVWGQACAEPRTLTRLLSSQAGGLGNVSCFLGVTVADDFTPMKSIGMSSYCASARNRGWMADGLLQIVDADYSRLPTMMGDSIAADVVLLLLPPPRHGYYHLGLADEYLTAAIDAARVVIAEVSPHVPCIPGGRLLAANQIDAVVQTDLRPVEMKQPKLDNQSVEYLVARNVAALVDDGATIQIGLGALPTAVLTQLRESNDLGVHSGLITDSIADLMELGVVSNQAKGRDDGHTVAGLIMGTQRLFDFVDGNAAIALRPTEYTHDPAVLASLSRFTAINSALEVDLSGQINTEVAAGRYVGAHGGAGDFLRRHAFQGRQADHRASLRDAAWCQPNRREPLGPGDRSRPKTPGSS
jgi:acyl-CoA hydrolase